MAVHEFFTEVEQTDIDGLPEALQGKASQADLDTVEGRLDSHEAATDPHPQYVRDDQATAENSFGGVVQRDEFGGFGASYIYGLGIPNNGWDAANKEYVDALGSDTIAGGRVVRRASDGWFEASGIYGLETPTNNSHAATKGYVDGRGSVIADGNTFALRDESGGFVVNWLGVGAAPINGPDVTNKTYVDASDVAWANAKADLDHDHAIADVTGLQTALDGKQAAGSYAAASHTHDDRYYTETEVDTLLAGKQAAGSYAAASHTHTIANVTNLQTSLDAKLDDSQLGVANGVASLDASGLLPISQLTSHAHDASDISQGTLSAARLPPRPFGTVTNTTTNTNAWNLDLSGAGIQLPLRLKWVLNHDTTFNVPTNPVGDGQLLRITGFANGGARVFNFAAGYVLSTGLSTRAIAIPSGKQMFASVEYSSDLAAWVLTACTVSA